MKHKIIYTEDYALIVSDEEIVIGDYVYCSRRGFEPLNKQKVNPLGSNNDSSMFKVIAHLPLTDAPILEGVPLLPEFSQPKRPKYFKCDIEDSFLLKNRKSGNTIMAKPKTITNSQGQTELVGKYIF
jgi:hypothetical protein